MYCHPCYIRIEATRHVFIVVRSIKTCIITHFTLALLNDETLQICFHLWVITSTTTTTTTTTTTNLINSHQFSQEVARQQEDDVCNDMCNSALLPCIDSFPMRLGLVPVLGQALTKPTQYYVNRILPGSIIFIILLSSD